MQENSSVGNPNRFIGFTVVGAQRVVEIELPGGAKIQVVK